MAADLFSLILSSAGSWAVSRTLDALVSCLRCGHRTPSEVENYETSNLACQNCRHLLDQYTNATDHSVNRNRSIAAGYISTLQWEAWGGLWQPSFQPRFHLDAVNSKYEDLVVRLTLSRFRGDTFFEDDMVLRPRYENSQWRDLCWTVPSGEFPSKGGTVSVDLILFNTWGDQLHQARSLMKYSGRSGNDDDESSA